MHLLRAHRPTPALVVSFVALLVALGGVASAAIPDSSGTIHACYNVDNQGDVGNNANLRVIDPAGGGGSGSEACKDSEASVSWNSGAGFGTDTGHALSSYGGAPCTIGQVSLTASHFVAANGLAARGQLLQISQYPVLFNVIGNTYGGDGTTTFALPDLRSVAPNHMTYSICDSGYLAGPR